MKHPTGRDSSSPEKKENDGVCGVNRNNAADRIQPARSKTSDPQSAQEKKAFVYGLIACACVLFVAWMVVSAVIAFSLVCFF